MHSEYLSEKLTSPIPTKDGGTLRTIREAWEYMTGVIRKRVETLFAHLKRIFRLGRLRLRGPRGAQTGSRLRQSPRTSVGSPGSSLDCRLSDRVCGVSVRQQSGW